MKAGIPRRNQGRFAIAFWLALLAWPLAAAGAECKRVVVSADPNYKPFHWYNGQALTGASVELVKRVLDDLHRPYEIRYAGAWPRVLKQAETGEIDIVTSLKDTPERREYLVFTSEPAFPNPMAVFVRRDRAFAFNRWDDLIGKRGGVNSGNRYGEGFDEFLRDKLTVEPVTEPAQNFKKLGAGYIDYYVVGLYSGRAYLADNKLDDQFMALPKPVNNGVTYVGFAKKSPCLSLLPKFNQRLGELNKQGVPTKLLEQYLGELRAPAKEPATH